MPVFPLRVPLPEPFYSDDTEAPFAECLVCDRSLLGGTTEYLIEKAYRRFSAYDVQETVFEYAICLECHLEIAASFSETSRHRCDAYFDEHVDLADRAVRLLQDPATPTDADDRTDAPLLQSGPLVRPDVGPEDVNLDDWLDRCVVHETPRGDLDEYQILAYCVGDELLLTHLPLVIGGTAMDEIVQRLSNETIDELGGFRDEYFGLPPDLQRDLSGPVLA